MDRVADLASTNLILNTVFRTQKRVHDLELQVASGKASQDYKGISSQSLRLLCLEDTKQQLERYMANNKAMELRADITGTTVEGMRETIKDFRQILLDVGANRPLDQSAVEDLQKWAFDAMTDLEAHLNTDVDGRYIYAGGRVDTKPVDFGLTTIEDFQATYDGTSVVYPPTRDAHVQTDISLDPTITGGLTMTGGDTITAANAGAFARLNVGQTITLSGSGIGNDGTYTVVSSNGSDQITISGALTAGPATINVTNSVTNGADGTVTLSSSDWYSGDDVPLTHRVDDDRFLNLDLTAIDPAFEKAIRAMGIIAQGAYGTPGGLNDNSERVDQALDLVNGALDRAGGGEPFGSELRSSLELVAMDIGFQQTLLNDAIAEHNEMVNFLTSNISDIENVETVEAVTKLLDQGRLLEAAYNAIAKVNSLSLADYLG